MKNYHQKQLFLMCLLLSSLFSGILRDNIKDSTHVQIIELPSAQDDNSLREYAYVYVDADSFVNVQYNMEGLNIAFSDETLDYIEELYPQLWGALTSINWYFYSGDDNNVQIYFYFNEIDLAVAKAYAEWLIGFVNELSITQYTFQGTWGDPGSIAVEYSASVPWPHLMQELEVNIPRDQGGLASTINVSSCDSFHWNWYISDRISTSLGFSWYYDSLFEELSGDFELDIKDLLHVDQLIKPLDSEGYTSIDVSLPDVENLHVIPAEATITNQSEWREKWDLNGYYSVDLLLDATFPSATAFNISFSYEFQPWDARSRQYYSMDLNAYGYTSEYLQIIHENATLIPFEDYGEQFDGDNFWSFDAYYFPEIYPNNDANSELTFTFRNLSAAVPVGEELVWGYNAPHPWFIENITAEIENRGWSVVDQSNYNSSVENDGYKYPQYRYDFRFNHTYHQNTWAHLWNSTEIYDISPFMQGIPLSKANYVHEYMYHGTHPGLYTVKRINWGIDSLYRYIEEPEKLFDESMGMNHTLNVAVDLLGASSIQTNDDEFLSSEVFLELPEDPTQGEPVISQPLSYGYGFNFHHWFDHDTWYKDGELMHLNYQLYTNEAHYYEGSGYTGDPDNIIVDFNYQFHPDTDDMVNPYGYMLDSSPYSGENATLVFEIRDDNSYGWWSANWYNSSDGQYYPRFPSSGIDSSSVEIDLYFNDIPIDQGEFHWGPYQAIYNNSTGYYELEVNTTLMPDGEILVKGSVADNANNIGEFQNVISIDNYIDANYLPPNISLLPGAPANNSHIAGEVTFTFNMTDDTEVFAATATVGPQIYLGTAYLLNETSPGIFEFTYNTQVEPENSDRWIVIKAYDKDGHQTELIYKFRIDNIPAGVAPEVEIISPASGLIFNASITPSLIFEVNATDDNGISSVQGQIDDRTPIDMIYNELTGFYELEYNIANLVNGSHTFTVIVYDIDDADLSGGGDGQHIVYRSINFTALTDIDPLASLPPEFKNVLPGNLTDSTDIISGDLLFNIQIKDDYGIEAVQLTLGTATDITDINVIPDTDSVNMQNYQTVSGYPKNMDLISTSGDWSRYQMSLDTTTITNGFYIVRIQIGDSDPIQHQVDIYFLILINNDAANNPFAEIPGYPVPIILLSISVTLGLLYYKKVRWEI